MKRPHIVIFNPDQWRGDVLGHIGNPAAVTPTLDNLVRTQAVSFRNAFCQNPVCTPSRCSFMTGWYPHVRGHRTMHHMLQPDEPCLLKMLKDEGYYIWWGGKNDLVPGQNSLSPYCSHRFHPTSEDYRRWGHEPQPGLHGWTPWRGEPGSDTYYSFYAGRLPADQGGMYFDHDWADIYGAVDFIRHAPQDQPLCIYLALSYPHPPYGVEEPWFSQGDRSKLPPRIPSPDHWQGKPSILRGLYERQHLQGWTEERWSELRATYYGMCARTDHQLSMIIAALREAGIWDDTALFVFSDHGDFTGDYGLVEKTQNTFEDVLTRVPLVIKPPTLLPVRPRVSDALIELVDFPATVYAMTGITPGYSHFGRSLLPILAGTTDTHRDAVFCEGGRLPEEMHASEIHSDTSTTSQYWPRMSLQIGHGPEHTKAVMCRTQHYKYVHRLDEISELYDLEADPCELHNRINDPALAAIQHQLKDRLLCHLLETCDVVPHQADSR